MDDAKLLQLLSDCYEPLTHRNVVAANMVRSASFTADDGAPGAGIPGVPPRLHANITLLAPGTDDAANAQLVTQIENRLLGVEAICGVTVTLLPALFPIL